jgi:1-acyl-sn-glycerol-3-phosphate acyltransferase
VSARITELRALGRLILRLTATVQKDGLEHIPRTGACILTLNHLGAFDIPLVGVFVNRDDATFLAADKYKKHFYTRWLIELMGGIWINRQDADRQALRAARDALKRGFLLGIAPEGTRSPTGSLIEGKQGAAYLAAVADAPLLPVAITGPETAFRRIARLRKAKLKIRFGPLYRLPPLEKDGREARLQENTDEIMCRIAALLPPAYRGVYSGHPRLAELLLEQPQPATAGA